MKAARIKTYCTHPVVAIYDSERLVGAGGDLPQPKLRMSFDELSSLLSFNFSLSRQSPDGQFSLTCYPQDAQGSDIFECVHLLDVVKIYELPEQATVEHDADCVFTGVVRSKRYVAQAQGGSIQRRLSISGDAITAIAAHFMVNMDATACIITNENKAAEALRQAFTANLADKKKLKDVVLAVWEQFLRLSEHWGTPAIAKLLQAVYGSDWQDKLFDVDDSSFHYPLGSVFSHDSAASFMDVIAGVVPDPLYERFSCFDAKTGNMRLVIRECPFDEEQWQALPNVSITGAEVTAYDVGQSDKEVYTTFYAYLSGNPLSQESALHAEIAQAGARGSDIVRVNADKFSRYGYRPLNATFIGYRRGADEGEQEDVNKQLAEQSARLEAWFSTLDEMLEGSVTLVMSDDTRTITPGTRVAFLGGEFYVEGIAHSWTYGQAGSITVSLSRGRDAQGGRI